MMEWISRQRKNRNRSLNVYGMSFWPISRREKSMDTSLSELSRGGWSARREGRRT